jgi:imidazolonepropionase-like amidohydrolase
LGVAYGIGYLQEVKDADIVVWDGKPLNLDSVPLFVLINGKVVKPE